MAVVVLSAVVVGDGGACLIKFCVFFLLPFLFDMFTSLFIHQLFVLAIDLLDYLFGYSFIYLCFLC